MGLIAGDQDQIKDAASLVENSVHFFQGSVSRFGVEEVDNRENEGVALNVSSRFSSGMGMGKLT